MHMQGNDVTPVNRHSAMDKLSTRYTHMHNMPCTEHVENSLVGLL